MAYVAELIADIRASLGGLLFILTSARDGEGGKESLDSAIGQVQQIQEMLDDFSSEYPQGHTLRSKTFRGTGIPASWIFESMMYGNSPKMALFQRSLSTFGGDKTTATVWLSEKCSALHARPIDIAGTEEGRQQIENVLACIDHGMIF
jgi:hypothetical protein